MKLNTTLVALALALAGGAASAATVGTLYDAATDTALANNPVLGPQVYTAFEQDGPAGTTPTFDYVYNFQLNATSDLITNSNTYQGPAVGAGMAGPGSVAVSARTAQRAGARRRPLGQPRTDP